MLGNWECSMLPIPEKNANWGPPPSWEADYAHHTTIGTHRFLDLPMAL